jgi:hypothetical protein
MQCAAPNQDFAMHEYEIRIVRGDGGTALLITATYPNEFIALSAARKFAGTHKFELWRGMHCISECGDGTVVYRSTVNLARTQ